MQITHRIPLVAILIAFALALPASTHAWYGSNSYPNYDYGYSGYGNGSYGYDSYGYSNSYGNSESFFFGTPSNSVYTQPREQLVVYSWGPSSQSQLQPSYHAYQPGNTHNNQYYPQQNSYGYNSYASQQSYSSQQNAYASYTYPQYNTQNYPSYRAPSYQSYSAPSYPSYSYAQPTGNKDFWGNDLCNWGSDYQGYACARDPHQWVYDSYTGSWY